MLSQSALFANNKSIHLALIFVELLLAVVSVAANLIFLIPHYLQLSKDGHQEYGIMLITYYMHKIMLSVV